MDVAANRKPRLIALLLGAGAALAGIGLLTQEVREGNFIICSVVYAGLWVAGFSAVLTVIFGAAAWVWRRRCFLYAATGFGVVAAMAAAQGIALPIGGSLREGDFREAERYCVQLIPALNAHKQAHGSYPDSIGEFLPKGGPRPRLLRGYDFYWVSKDGSEFNFAVGRGFPIHVFDSGHGTWHWD